MFPTTIKCHQDFPAHSKPKLKTASASLKKETKKQTTTKPGLLKKRPLGAKKIECAKFQELFSPIKIRQKSSKPSFSGVYFFLNLQELHLFLARPERKQTNERTNNLKLSHGKQITRSNQRRRRGQQQQQQFRHLYVVE
jgi:hypothetical protein